MNLETLFQKDIDDVAFTVLDVETTGLDPRREKIIEFAGYRIERGEIVDSFISFFNPERRLDPYIVSFTGIRDEDLEDAPLFEDVASKVMELLNDSVIVGHNIQFDVKFLEAEFFNAGYESFKPVTFCTLRGAKRLYPQLKSKRLEAVRDHLNIPPGVTHRAYSDAKATAEIFLKMADKLRKDFQLSRLQDVLGFQYIPPRDLSRKFPQTLAQTGFEIPAIPDLPGNYWFLDATENIIYIGKSKTLRKRLAQHLMDNAAGKSKLILGTAVKLCYETTSTEVMALVKEAQLIKKFRPKHNVQLKNYGNKYFIRVSVRHQYPKLEIVNSFDLDGNDYFGLFISRSRSEEILEIAEKSFRLRTCTQKELEKGRACFMATIDRCLAPCEKEIREEYREELQKFYEFMAGKNSDLISELIRRMTSYSADLKFEQAAEIKKTVDLVLNQIHRSSLLKEPVNRANVMISVSGDGGVSDHFLLLEGKVYIRGFSFGGYDNFDNALDDFFDGNRRLDLFPTDEDYERMRIILNWSVQNRDRVKIYYLNDYASKTELFKKMSSAYFSKVEYREIAGEIDISKLNLNL